MISFSKPRDAISAKTGRRSIGSFWSWNIGERMVVYLAVCDLLFSISHVIDHAYIVAVHDHPPVGLTEGFIRRLFANGRQHL